MFYYSLIVINVKNSILFEFIHIIDIINWLQFLNYRNRLKTSLWDSHRITATRASLIIKQPFIHALTVESMQTVQHSQLLINLKTVNTYRTLLTMIFYLMDIQPCHFW